VTAQAVVCAGQSLIKRSRQSNVSHQRRSVFYLVLGTWWFRVGASLVSSSFLFLLSARETLKLLWVVNKFCFLKFSSQRLANALSMSHRFRSWWVLLQNSFYERLEHFVSHLLDVVLMDGNQVDLLALRQDRFYLRSETCVFRTSERVLQVILCESIRLTEGFIRLMMSFWDSQRFQNLVSLLSENLRVHLISCLLELN